MKLKQIRIKEVLVAIKNLYLYLTPVTVLMMTSLVRSYTQQPPRKILNKELGMGKG